MNYILSFYRWWKPKGKKDEDMLYSKNRKELDDAVTVLNKEHKQIGFFRVRKEGEE